MGADKDKLVAVYATHSKEFAIPFALPLEADDAVGVDTCEERCVADVRVCAIPRSSSADKVHSE